MQFTPRNIIELNTRALGFMVACTKCDIRVEM